MIPARLFLIALVLVLAGCSDNENYDCVANPPKTTTEVPHGCHADIVAVMFKD